VLLLLLRQVLGGGGLTLSLCPHLLHCHLAGLPLQLLLGCKSQLLQHGGHRPIHAVHAVASEGPIAAVGSGRQQLLQGGDLNLDCRGRTTIADGRLLGVVRLSWLLGLHMLRCLVLMVVVTWQGSKSTGA
jgi:hypothetical protein